ncbi:MAG: UDP-N-acetylmuramoyl-tripeptide--D-alanyl-D-alanine ligase [Pyrinomonadaceae bacterium]
MNLETAANLMNAEVKSLSPDLLSAVVKGFSIDSRTTADGELFFALAQPDYQNNGFNGKFADAHQFIPEAFERGAVAAIARFDKLLEHAFLEKFHHRLLFVEDGIAALQRLAAGVYKAWNKPVVAVTGSAGKTTAKQLTAEVLAASGRRVLTNIKNYNNGLGHPLTVLRLVTEGDFDVAVLEMGMSTPLHEIERLCRITPPDVAVELNVLPVHLEHLETIENIAAAKAELIENMKSGGRAILNADDSRVLAMRNKLNSKQVLTYGIENAADVTATHIKTPRFGETRFLLNLPNGTANIALQLVGRHNVSNALAAAAVGFCFEMRPEEIAAALGKAAPPPMRGEVLRFLEGFEVVNDSYNSNPDALLSMVATVVESGDRAKRVIVVAGEMLELGDKAEQIHFETGKKIARLGVDALFGVRGLAQNLVAGAKEDGLPNVHFFSDSDQAANAIVDEIKTGDLVLVKGSRGVRMEKIVEGLLGKFSRTD